MVRTLIYIEQEHPRDAVDLCQCANLLHADETGEVYGLGSSEALALANGLLDVALCLGEHAADLQDDPRAIVELIEFLHKEHSFDTVLFADTPMGSMISARLAVRMGATLVTDVSGIITTEDGKRLFERPASGRRQHGLGQSALIEVDGDKPLLLTAQARAFRTCENNKDERGKPCRLVPIKKNLSHTAGLRLLKRETLAERDIRDSDILISGGGGVAEGFEALNPLAEALNAQVSASRAVVDRHIAPRSRQVGQSGNRVSPSLYMAIGIHGAIQHIAGLEDVAHIISVNTNAEAPINSLADIVVKGDALTFVDRLLRRIKEEQSYGTH